MRRDRCHPGGFLLRIMPPSWRPVPACTPRLCCRRAILRCRNGPTQAGRSTLRLRKLESDAVRYCGRDRCHSGGFYLGLCRLRGILSPPAPHDCAAGGLFFAAATVLRRRTVLLCGNDLTQAELFYFATKKIGIGRSNVAAKTAVGGPFYLPARWRCIDSRFQAQTCESMQPKGQNKGNPCIDS